VCPGFVVLLLASTTFLGWHGSSMFGFLLVDYRDIVEDYQGGGGGEVRLDTSDQRRSLPTFSGLHLVGWKLFVG
jgi:hypothetical protein